MPINKKIEKSNKNLTTTTTMTRRDRLLENVDLTGLAETFGTSMFQIVEAEAPQLSIEDIEERVKKAILNAKNYPLTFDNQYKSFTQDLGFDSLDFLEIIYSIENEFAIVIPDDIMDSLDTFNKIVDYITKLKLMNK